MATDNNHMALTGKALTSGTEIDCGPQGPGPDALVKLVVTAAGNATLVLTCEGGDTSGSLDATTLVFNLAVAKGAGTYYIPVGDYPFTGRYFEATYSTSGTAWTYTMSLTGAMGD